MIATRQQINSQPAFEPTRELQELSTRMAALQEALFQLEGIETVYIGAGSALAILDHCLRGQSLTMRDLDVFVCREKTMTVDSAHCWGEALEGPVLGEFSRHDVRPRRRGNPTLPCPQAYDYNSGYGLFLINQQQQILDLTVFHSHSDMLLNGIMNVDRVRIRLTHGTSLIQQLSPLSDGRSLSESSSASCHLAKLGIEDDHNGYSSWCRQTAELVNDFDVQRAPLETILRIIRTFGKFARPQISRDTVLRLKKLLDQDADGKVSFYTVRGLIKLLNDRNVRWNLQLLRELGGIKKIGGLAGQQLKHLYASADRLGGSTWLWSQQLQVAVDALSQFEHEMKLEGVC